MQAPTIGTVMAQGPVLPFKYIQPVQKGAAVPFVAPEGQAVASEEPYEAYGLAGLQNTLSDI